METERELGEREGPRETSALHALVADIDLPRRMRERPYAVLGVALAAGYVLGGGFFSPATRPLARMAFGAWLRPRAVLVAEAVRERLLARREER